ncbi:MAG: CheW-like protein [Verrucomicrobiales bacterium]|nr:CheW-like protein [Verrucomicrobiales bacterium]
MNASPSTSIKSRCWMTEGVWGNASCPKLEAAIHCRNCHVYADAAASLLERQFTTSEQQEWSRNYLDAREVVTAKKVSVVVFRIGTEWLSIKTSYLTEICPERAVHAVPHKDRKILQGLTNIRGELLICINLAQLLQLGASSQPAVSRRFLVLQHLGKKLVFCTDEVTGLRDVRDTDLKLLPITVSQATGSFARSAFDWNERTVGILDAELLFFTVEKHLG